MHQTQSQAGLSCLKSPLAVVCYRQCDRWAQELWHHCCAQKTSPETPILSGHTYRSNEGTEPHSPRQQPSLSCTGPRYLLLTFLSWLPSLSLPMSALQSLTAHESTLETERWREALFTLHLYLLVALANGFEQKRELETIGPNDAPRETAPMLSGS